MKVRVFPKARLAAVLCAGVVVGLSADVQAQLWLQLGQDIDGAAAGDGFGWSGSLSADGTTALIGARYNDGSGTDAGHARAYDWNGTDWIQRGTDINGGATYDWFGHSSALSADGNTAIIGAHTDVSMTGLGPGYANVYDWDLGSNNWVQRGLNIEGEAMDDLFGRSVALSSDGNTALIGGVRNDGNGTSSGHARIYDWDGTIWTQRGMDIDGEAAGDRFGWTSSLSSDGNTALISSVPIGGGGVDTGYTSVYDWDGTDWVQRGLGIYGEGSGDFSGFSSAFSASGDTMLIGAQLNDAAGVDAGHARVYDWNGTDWVQRGLDIDGLAAGELFGRSVDISDDGNTLLIGAATSGIGSGSARLYDWDGAAWVQRGPDMVGEAFDDRFGHAVSLSADGNTVLATASLGDGINGSDSGYARIYQWNPPDIDLSGATAQLRYLWDGDQGYGRDGLPPGLTPFKGTIEVSSFDLGTNDFATLQWAYTPFDLSALNISEETVRLYWFDEANDTWILAGEGSNNTPNGGQFVLGGPTSNLGDWGLDLDNNFAWANIDHASEYALVGLSLNAVPEPSGIALLGLGGLAVMLRRRRV